ncbi:MAG: DUF460 domain-containing protein [Candidatus Woesearchaeota archaeon]|nr:DUF460 domain-containing protein [Candidatus Woesearchaeota archaeon]
MKTLLVIGIDPGTTSAYAVFDINKQLIKKDYSKEHNISRIISEVMKLGKPLLVGSDKNPPSSFVVEFAAKTGAELIYPDKDLLVEEKKEFAKELVYSNPHELDAISSALFVFKRLSALFTKLDIFVKENKIEDIENELKEKVIREKISMKTALDEIKKKSVVTIYEKREIIIKRQPEDYEKLRKELELVRDFNKKLNQRIEILQAKNKKLFERISSKPEVRPEGKYREMLGFKENKIFSLSKNNKKQEEELSRLKEDLKNIHSFISKIGDENFLAKKLDNFTNQEFESKNKILNIGKEDVLFVDDPNTYSERIIESLKDKVRFVIFKKEPSKKLRENFIFINSKEIQIEENEYFAIANKKDFESQKEKADILSKVVQEYRREKAA